MTRLRASRGKEAVAEVKERDEESKFAGRKAAGIPGPLIGR
jgi:hypothetical protein